ncbi:MAG: type II secretion system minor pseudopilin GspK [Cellvibrionales bacterium]|nr:type II secretion system minor pseudopilin GspK [Cellvibrionales bacterium]
MMSVAKSFTLKKKQTGAALVVAMLIISLVTAIAATSSLRHHFMLRRLSNQLKVTQLNSYLQATEMIAKKALTADLQLDAEQKYRYDHFGEIWAQKVPPFLIDGGSYGGEIIDLQSKFNLNMLATPEQYKSPNRTLPYTIQQGIFIRLLQSYNDDNLQITSEQAVEILKAVLDWVDPDTTANFSYCEDDAYTTIEKRKPHRTANQPFMSVSELRLLCNMPPELYIRIKDDLTVWPRTGKSTINVNTASAAILKSVIIPSQDAAFFQKWKPGESFQVPRPLEDRDIEQFLEQQKQGFTSWSQVQSTLSYFDPWPSTMPVLSLHSDYFLLRAQAELDGLTQRYLSVLDRTQPAKIVVLFRSYDDL